MNRVQLRRLYKAGYTKLSVGCLLALEELLTGTKFQELDGNKRAVVMQSLRRTSPPLVCTPPRNSDGTMLCTETGGYIHTLTDHAKAILAGHSHV